MHKGFHGSIRDGVPLDSADAFVSGIGDAAAITAPPTAPDPLEGVRWASNAITWSFATANLPGQPVNFTGAMTGLFAALVQKAVLMWQSVADISLTQVADSSASDIRIGFEALSGNALGLTNWSSSGGSFSTDVTVGVEDPGLHGVTLLPDGDVVYSGLVSVFFQVIAHELGHALGLAHNLIDSQAVMQPNATALNRSIDPNDVAGMQLLYGPSTSGSPHLGITDSGPDSFDMAPGASINPFTDLMVSDGVALNETVTVTVTGDGTLRDPTAGTDESFVNGVFRETGVSTCSRWTRPS